MGSGQVRGMAATVYETVADGLSCTMFERAAWTDSAGGQPEPISLFDVTTSDGDHDGQYVLVYFVGQQQQTDGSEPQRRPLRLDVYQLASYRVDLFDFQWRLTTG
jgi:hypothetical protein